MKGTAFFLALLLGAATAEARMSQMCPMQADARAEISLGSCFDVVALSGYAPIDVTINNHSGGTRRWVVSFTSPGYAFGAMNSVTSSFSLTVENNSTRAFPLMVPMQAGGQYAYNPLEFQVSGYGANGSMNSGIASNSYNGNQRTRFVVMSESVGASIWSSLSSDVRGAGKDLIGSTVNPDELPEDWRGLSGVAMMWLTGDELNHLSPGQREAVRTWVRAGGRLMLCASAEVPEDFSFTGFGRAKAMPAKLDTAQAAAEIEALPAFDNDPSPALQASPEYSGFATVHPNVPLLSCFMGLFALVVGPLNIFVLTRRRRERLLWSTPLISISASGLLMGIIVMQDGAGGRGERRAVVCIFPREHNAVISQEQISRTGLVMNSAFRTRDPVLLQQLDLAAVSRGQGRSLRVDGNVYSQNWFTSRACQAQRIVAAAPSRAEITLLNASAAAKGAPPVIVSSFGRTLRRVCYRDKQDRIWQAGDLRTGQKQAMQPAPGGQADNPLPASIRDLSERASDACGWFWAVSSEGGDYIPTLDSIHWKDAPITYAGEVTAAR